MTLELYLTEKLPHITTLKIYKIGHRMQSS